MRRKELCYVIAFHTTAEAMAFEKQSGIVGLPGRLIPVPRTISAGCGMAWKTKKMDILEKIFWECLREMQKGAGITVEAVYEICL